MKKIITICTVVSCFFHFAFSQNIAGGSVHTLVICGDSIARSFGDNSSGQLGTGNNFNSNFPVQVTNLTNVVRVSAGLAHSLAVKNNGTVRAWGWNGSGQLGNGNNSDSNVPVVVSGLSNVVSISGGWNHSLAAKSDGTAWSWGNNFDGQLGIGTSMDSSNVPVQVSGLTGIVQVAGGDFHSLALKNNGTVWVWGGNGYCQYGNGFPLSSSMVPVQVPAFNNVVAIATGRAHCLAIKNDSTLWAWGDNTYGQLGDSTTNMGCLPARVNGLSGIVAVAAGYGHTIALKSDGTVWTWGENDHYQLGDGNNTDRYYPMQVSGLFNVTAIGAGLYHSIVMKSDGTVWSWGENQAGQLGIGNNSSSSIPVLITGLCQIATSSEGKNFIPLLNIFPNPVTNQLIIDNGNLPAGQAGLKIENVEIFDAIGAKIFQSRLSVTTNYQLSIDTSRFPSGIYFLKVKTGEGISAAKFVKE